MTFISVPEIHDFVHRVLRVWGSDFKGDSSFDAWGKTAWEKTWKDLQVPRHSEFHLFVTIKWSDFQVYQVKWWEGDNGVWIKADEFNHKV